MNDREKGVRKLDQVDRRSQVGVSRALRARDVSRPAAADVEAALERIEKTPLPPRTSPKGN
ncbi:hypothetical protein E1262_13440 [Jiangella aurantiaca]|uniref:Uncharacterized protein n=1 Tax=Jiangella aurantiaca TaxID=2530373 RepID=A0A4R5AAI3_9ACTN|nr:hypothetical protein [Jiangella aurantiaca]TDD69318.1 hypothetical protein E1262_13440 [Jiangella aurantiaca]